jgi:hypothetical protein
MAGHCYNPCTRRLKQEECRFKASLGYMARPCLTKTKTKNIWSIYFCAPSCLFVTKQANVYQILI